MKEESHAKELAEGDYCTINIARPESDAGHQLWRENTGGSKVARSDYNIRENVTAKSRYFGLEMLQYVYDRDRLLGEYSQTVALVNRYDYESAQGRFMPQDIRGRELEDTKSWNRRTYPLINPLRWSGQKENYKRDLGRADSWYLLWDLTNSTSTASNVVGFTGLFFYEVGDTLTVGGATRADRIISEESRVRNPSDKTVGRMFGNLIVSLILIAMTALAGGLLFTSAVGID